LAFFDDHRRARRIQAARKLGFHEAPVMVASGWSEAKKRAYVIADNELALNAAAIHSPRCWPSG
jgi:ParB-like chromosome segregation protein Spo0J